MSVRMYDLILKKKQGGALTKEEIGALIRGYTAGDIPDYQMSAFLMAVCFRGMNKEETAALALAMAGSGKLLDLSSLGVTVDKHSSGGVGDKTTLIVLPLAAACGCHIYKMSGRGLGHTGGTVDKMESFRGIRMDLPFSEASEQVKKLGLCLLSQSEGLVPADKKIYALRDVTATVDSVPLIASSIMSKKIASGADALVLDVKMGSGAFMKTLDDALTLARTMVEIGTAAGIRTAAVITDMSRPLGREIGNQNEVAEAIRMLRGEEPLDSDLGEVALAITARMIELSGICPYDEAMERAKQAIADGSGLRKLRDMVASQGGDITPFTEKSCFPPPQYHYLVTAEKSGFIGEMNCEGCGLAAMTAGAGRRRKEDAIDLTAGITVYKKTGDPVKAGEPIAKIMGGEKALLTAAAEVYRKAVPVVSEKPAEKMPAVRAVVTEDGIRLM